MPEEAQVQATPETAASEPAATMTAPPHPFAPKVQPDQPDPERNEAAEAEAGASAPASDDAPEQASADPSPDAEQIDWEARFKELENRLAETQPKLSEYEQWQQQQAEAARRQQLEAARQQYEEYRTDVRNRLMAVDSEDEADKLLDSMAQRLMGTAQQRFQAEMQRIQNEHQQQFSQYEQQLQSQLVEVYKPAFADQLIAEKGLPAQFRDTLLQVDDPDQMPAIADLLSQTLAQSAPQVQQQVAQQKAEHHRENNTFATAEGAAGPAPKSFEAMRATSAESLAALGQILNGR